MTLPRRTVLAGSIAAALIAPIKQARSESLFYASTGKAIRAVRVYSEGDGDCEFEDIEFAFEEPAGGNGGAIFQQPASRVVVFSGPANAHIPARPTPMNTVEMLYVIEGETSFRGQSETRRCPAGTLLIFEDTGGSGHEEMVGPNGYTAFKIQIAAEDWP